MKACKAAKSGEKVMYDSGSVIYSMIHSHGKLYITSDDSRTLTISPALVDADWQEAVDYFDFSTAIEKLENGEMVICEDFDKGCVYHLDTGGAVIAQDISDTDTKPRPFTFTLIHYRSKRWRVYKPSNE
jgi:hypothetical protein